MSESEMKRGALQQREKALQGMQYFNQVLERSPYVAGEHFSMADITVFAGLIFAEVAGVPIPQDAAALRAWREKVSALPSVRNRSGQTLLPEDLRRLGF